MRTARLTEADASASKTQAHLCLGTEAASRVAALISWALNLHYITEWSLQSY
jgi:hypothetical protein